MAEENVTITKEQYDCFCDCQDIVMAIQNLSRRRPVEFNATTDGDMAIFAGRKFDYIPMDEQLAREVITDMRRILFKRLERFCP